MASRSSAVPHRRRGRPPNRELEEQRRGQIIASAITVFADRGYEGASISDIARHAGVGQGTIYRYVPSKRDLLDLIFDQSVEEIIHAVGPALDGGEQLTDPTQLIARLDAALDAVTQTLDRRPELLSMVLVEAGAMDEELKHRILGLEGTVARLVVNLLWEAKSAGFLRPGVDPEVCGLLATKLILPVGLREVAGRYDALARQRHRTAIVDLAGHALLADPEVLRS